MTVYAFGLTHADVTPELPHMTFGASSKPTTTQIGVWITGYCAEVLVMLEGLGVCTNATASTTISASVNEPAYHSIRRSVIEAVVARIRLSNQEQDDGLAQAMRESWAAFLETLKTYPWKALGTAEPSARVRSSFSAWTPGWSTGESFR